MLLSKKSWPVSRLWYLQASCCIMADFQLHTGLSGHAGQQPCPMCSSDTVHCWVSSTWHLHRKSKLALSQSLVVT